MGSNAPKPSSDAPKASSSQPSESVPMSPGFEQMYAATKYKIAEIDKKIAADKVAKSLLTKSTKGVAVPGAPIKPSSAPKAEAQAEVNIPWAQAKPPAAADQPAKPNEGVVSTAWNLGLGPVHDAWQMMMPHMKSRKGQKGPTAEETQAIKRAAEQANRPVPTFALLPIQKGKLKVFRKGIDDFRQLLMKNDFHTKS